MRSEKGNAFLGLLAAIGLLLFLAWYLLVSPTSPLLTDKIDIDKQIAEGKTYLIEMTDRGFAPKDLNIQVFDTVKFINKDQQVHWPASGEHPTHQLCPGFDALRPLAPGESYSIVFEKSETCPFHDHLQPVFKGKIVIQ